MERAGRLERMGNLERLERHFRQQQRREQEEAQMPLQQPFPQRFPVLVFPVKLDFILDDRLSHKQVLTIYNVFDYPVKFKVLCTNPEKYTVVDPQGKINPRCCVDLVIRHNSPSHANLGIVDRFRVQILEKSSRPSQILGRSDVEAVLLRFRREPPEEEVFRVQPQNDLGNQLPGRELPLPQASREREGNLLFMIIGLICIFAMLLPTERVEKKEEESESVIPKFFHLSHQVKYLLCITIGAMFPLATIR